jgi:hypothetical protein
MATKECNVCHKVKSVSDFYKGSKASRSVYSYACKLCTILLSSKNYQKRIEENPDELRAYKNSWNARNREKNRLAGKKHRLKVRLLVIEGYGGKCSCCGESEIKFLTIEHENKDGKKHRKETNGHYYQDLIKRGFPKGYTVLCFNCNCAKGFYEVCPHQLK